MGDRNELDHDGHYSLFSHGSGDNYIEPSPHFDDFLNSGDSAAVQVNGLITSRSVQVGYFVCCWAKCALQLHAGG